MNISFIVYFQKWSEYSTTTLSLVPPRGHHVSSLRTPCFGGDWLLPKPEPELEQPYQLPDFTL